MAKDTQKVLIVDDEPDLLELLSITLGRMGLAVERADGCQAAIRKLQQQHYDLCITDLKMPDGNGMEVLEHIQQNNYNTAVAMLTAHGDIDTAIEALKLGAFDFVNKPIDLGRLRQLVTSALQTPSRNADQATDQLIGNGIAMDELRQMVRKVSRNQAPVYIHGESGSGKELVARMIHQLGPRQNGPFIPINCGAIPSELMESEFFGHKRGSFTGATADKVGLFEAANGGTLFLDEIGDLPLSMQVKLLHAIQEKRVRPIGSHSEIDVDIRFLSASHKNLADLVDKGDFRADLFYRLNVIGIQVPPLRQRLEDLEVLCHHVLNKLGRHDISLASDALGALRDYDFPGNIRELENILERAITLCDSTQLHAHDLKLRAIKTAQAATKEQPRESVSVGFIDLEAHLAGIERKLITDALEATRWNRTAAAKRLGLNLRSMRYRLKKLGIE